MDDDDQEDEPFQDARSKAILAAIEPLDWHLMVLENWFVDIATTFHYMDAGYSLFPKKQTHSRVLSTLTGLTATEATTVVDRGARTGYHIDEIAHLGDTAGMRVETLKSPFVSPLNVHYAQVYASGDKDLTALKDKNRVAKHVEPRFIFSDFDHIMSTFFAPLMAVFQAALAEQQTVNVRMESRVPLMDATSVHRWFDPTQFSGYLIKVKTRDYWQWKLIRLQSIIATLTKMHPCLPDIPRIKLTPAGTLGVGLCYMANALVNRPEQGSDFTALADTLSVHEIKRGVLTAVRPLVAFFLHSLYHQEQCPRISMVRVLELPQISRLCHIAGDPTGTEAVALIKRSKIRQREPALPQWGKVPGTDDAAPLAPSTASNAPGVGPVSRSKHNKLAMGYDEQDVVFGDNDDIPEPPVPAAFAEEADDPEVAPQAPTNRTMLNDIFHRMAGEMLLKIPEDKQTKESWRAGDDNKCHEMRFKDLCDSRTVDRMLRGYRMTTNASTWERSVKKILPSGEELRKIKYKAGTNIPKKTFIQGLAQCHFFQEWSTLVENRDGSLTDKQLEDLVKVARKKLNEQAQWLPVGKSDRLWADAGANGAKLHGIKVNGKEPQVVVLNPKFPRDTDVPGGY
ncbi:hypothetical protein FRC11_009752 [Ceratobasidium sp. 423]|nr:hypothetical protein FRC11_009752 [Ceratobasidium sp. 423]